MHTDFVPVTCQCKSCKRYFVEWFAYADVVGKTEKWRPKLDCDECFSKRVLPFYRNGVLQNFANRSKQMFERYPNADLTLLDSVHQAMFKRKLAGNLTCTIDDTFAYNNPAIRGSE